MRTDPIHPRQFDRYPPSADPLFLAVGVAGGYRRNAAAGPESSMSAIVRLVLPPLISQTGTRERPRSRLCSIGVLAAPSPPFQIEHIARTIAVKAMVADLLMEWKRLVLGGAER